MDVVPVCEVAVCLLYVRRTSKPRGTFVNGLVVIIKRSTSKGSPEVVIAVVRVDNRIASTSAAF